MRHLRLLFAMLLFVYSTGIMAEKVIIDGITYDVVTKAKIATVVAKETGKYSGDVVIRKSIVCNGITCDVTSVGNEAFENCYDLKSIEIPNSVTTIEAYAFRCCGGLENITIPNSVTKIGESAFSGCSMLKSIEIPNSVINIGAYAFSGCIKLANITIPNSVTNIGNNAFSLCYNLTSVTIPSSITKIETGVFNECYGLTRITIPNSVVTIEGRAFEGCCGLTNITIPNSVTSIKYNAFYGCYGLTSITLPNSVTKIGERAFEGCSGLTSIIISNTIKSIASKAFAGCSNLTDVYCLATTVPSADAKTFDESYPEYMTLHVPAEAINDYKATTPWNNFGKIVTLEGGDDIKKCAIPSVAYSNGYLTFSCDTEGTEFVTDITSNDFGKFYSNNIKLSATYNICVYATATGYENSETLNATLCWIENGESEGSTTGIINTPATAALITYTNGTLAISCSLNGETVAVYTTDGVLVGTTTIENGSATIATGLSKDTIVIVKIGEKSIKIIMQ